MSNFRQTDYVAGRLVEPGGHMGAWLCDPSTGADVVVQATTGIEVVGEALAVADEAHRVGEWAGLAPSARADLLDAIAVALESRLDDIAEVEGVCTGLPAPIASAFAGAVPESFRDAAARIRQQVNPVQLGEAQRVVELWRHPWGPTAVLVPWNAAAAMAAKKSAYALAAGNPVILKPSEWSPFSSTLIAEAIDEVGLPPGTFQLVHGGAEVGQALTGDPRVRAISFTGSVATGASIAGVAAPHFAALQLELGGNNPVIVRADVDVDAAAASLADGMVKLNGQWCEGPGKVWVDAGIHDEFAEALLDRLSSYSMGPHTSDADMGPLSHASHRRLLDEQMAQLVAAGGQVLSARQQLPESGWFWAPRVVIDAPEEACVEEMFGPVVTVHPMHSEGEAIAAANASPYGLAAYVFGTDLPAAYDVARQLRFGEVKVNGTSLLDMSEDSAQSFWRSSGIGGHGNRELLEFFQGVQIVGSDRPGLPI